MKEINITILSILRGLRKTLFWTITSVVILLFLLIILLQTSLVQNYVAGKVLAELNARTRETANFKKIRIKWFDFVEIKGLEVLDYRKNTMISANRMQVDYQLGRLLHDGQLSFDLVSLEEGGLHLKKYQDTMNINLIEWIYGLGSLQPASADSVTNARSGQPFELAVGKVRLEHFQFSYENQLSDSLPGDKFDYSHFLVDIPGGFFENFSLRHDTIQADIRSLVAKDQATGLALQSLKTNFRISNSGMDFDELELETEYSHVTNRASFRFTGMYDLTDFVDSVSFNLDLEGSKLDTRDLNLFTTIPAEDFVAEITAKISGTVPRLSVEQLQLHIGKSHVNGNIDFMGLPYLNETFIDARINDSEVWPEDVDPFVGYISPDAMKLGEIQFSGRFLGFTNDFVANGDFKTALGGVSSDINLKFRSGLEQAKYSGELKLTNFDLGEVTGNPDLVGRLNLNGTIDGKGLTRRSANFYLNAYLVKSEFLNYRFEEINANGQFASDFFQGELEVIDPNCTISARGSVDLKAQAEKIHLRTRIDALNFQQLGLMQENLQLEGNISADLIGLNLDSLEGAIDLKNMDVVWKKDTLHLDSAEVSSASDGHERAITVNMPEFTVDLNGDFYFSQIANDMQLLADEFSAYFDPSFQKAIKKKLNFHQYSLDFVISYKDPSMYTILVDDDFYVSPNGKIEGSFYQRENATLSILSEIDSIHYRGGGYKGNRVDVNVSKDLYSKGIVASLYLDSDKQYWERVASTTDLSVEAVWFDDKINLNAKINQPDNNSSANLSGEMQIFSDRLTFTFLPSRLVAFGEQWQFNPYNKVVLTNEAVILDRLELYQNDQSIALTGQYSDSLSTDLNLVIRQFDLKAVNGILPGDFFGVVNSSVHITRQDWQGAFLLNSNLAVNGFGLSDFLVGDVSGFSDWNASEEKLKIDLKVGREEVNTISVKGDYAPQDSVSELDIVADFNQANLGLLNPFLGFLFSDINGLADGRIELTGSLNRPVLNGSTQVENGRFRFDYLGATYDFDGQVSFDNKSINFDKINLRDEDKNKALLTGSIYHQGFSNMVADLSVSANRFRFLDTDAEDNSLFYGTANASGNIAIKGPFEDLLIEAKATTEKGTKIYIPLSDDEEGASQKEYISFVDLSDTTKSMDIEEKVRKSISGIRLNFDIDVTTDAYVELIFDIRTGDIIRGRGNGTLNLSLDTDGEFELFGDLTITEGAYNFTIAAIGISKEFTLVPGGTISWYGDPYAAVLNLQATYRQLASFSDYTVSTTDTGDETIAQKYPVLVLLKLKGDMMAPSIDFLIELEDSQTSPTTEVQQALSSINSNEQELKRQVFSLLILRKFSPQSSFSVSGSNAVGGSLSEFLSNQFSYFISQVDENLQVDVDLSSLDADAFNTFQLRLSYTFMNGRLRVTGGGAFPQSSSSTSTTSTSATSTFVGDWSVRYLLTPDGHLRVRAFSQSEQITSQTQRETGVSFQYIKSFNDLKELLSKTREEAIKAKPKNMDAEKAANQSI